MMTRFSGIWLAPLLTAVGRKLHIDAHYFAKNSFFVLVGQALSIVRGVVTGYLVTRFFSTQVYGEYQFILSVMGMLSLFTFMGASTAVSRAWSRDDHFSLNAVSLYQAKLCLVGSLILVGSIPFLSWYDRQSLWPLFLAAAVIFPLPPLAMLRFPAYAIGKGRFDLTLQAGFVWTILVILSTLAILIFWQSSILMLITGTAIPPLVYFWYGRHIRSPQESGDREATKKIIRYGWHLTLSTLPVELVWYIDRLLISHYLGLAQLATFSVALLIPEQAKVLLKQLLPISFSRQAKIKDSHESRRKLMKVVLLGTALFALGIAVYIAICPIIIPLLFPRYDATQVIWLTSLAAITLIVQPMSLFSQHLEARRMIRELWITNCVSSVVFLVSLLVLIPWYGLAGAIIARGIFRCISSGITCWYIVRLPIRE